MAGGVIARNPSCKLTFGTVVLDISDYVVAVEPSSEAEQIDMGTFANPKASETGRVTDAVTIAVLWAPGLYDMLAPYVNVQGTVEARYAASDPKAIRAAVKYGTLPWGRVEVGQRIEADLVLVVPTGDISYT